MSLQNLADQFKETGMETAARLGKIFVQAESLHNKLPVQQRFSFPQAEITDRFTAYSWEIKGLTGSNAVPTLAIIDEEQQWGEVYRKVLREWHPQEFHEFTDDLVDILAGDPRAIAAAFSVSHFKPGHEAALTNYGWNFLQPDTNNFFQSIVLTVGNQLAFASERQLLHAYAYSLHFSMTDRARTGRGMALKRITSQTNYDLASALTRVHLPAVYEQARKLSSEEKSAGTRLIRAILGMGTKDIIAVNTGLGGPPISDAESRVAPPEFFAGMLYSRLKQRMFYLQEAGLPDRLKGLADANNLASLARNVYSVAAAAAVPGLIAEIVLKEDKDYAFSRRGMETAQLAGFPEHLQPIYQRGRSFVRQLYAREGKGAFQLLAKRLPSAEELGNVELFIKNASQ